MIRAQVVLALFMWAAGLGFASCKSACDERALLAVTQTLELELSTAGAEERALKGIAGACPQLNWGLTDVLRDKYVPPVRSSSMKKYGDGFYAAKNAACDDPQRWIGEVRVAAFESRAEIFYEACGLARLGVLDDGERILHGDEDFFFMLAALDRSGVSRGIVRRLGRGLLNGVAPLSVAHQRCTENDDDVACQRLIEGAGVELIPMGENSGPFSGHRSLRLLISPETILWDGVTIAKLDHGSLRPEDVDNHRILPLTAVVEAWGRHIEDDKGAFYARPRLEIAVDRRLSMGLVTDILSTVTSAGVSNLALVGETPTGLTTTPLWVLEVDAPHGKRWSAGPLAIDDAGLYATLPSGEMRMVPADATEAVRAIVEEMRGSGYGQVLVRAAPSVRAGVVVPVLREVGGSQCLNEFVYQQYGHGCLRATLDLDSTAPLRSRFGLSIPRLRTVPRTSEY